MRCGDLRAISSSVAISTPVPAAADDEHRDVVAAPVLERRGDEALRKLLDVFLRSHQVAQCLEWNRTVEAVAAQQQSFRARQLALHQMYQRIRTSSQNIGQNVPDRGRPGGGLAAEDRRRP